MDVNSNVNGLHSEPGFHPEARYEFKVHFDGAEPGGRKVPPGPVVRVWMCGLAGSPGAAEILHAEAAGLDVEDEMRGWLVVAVGDGL